MKKSSARDLRNQPPPSPRDGVGPSSVVLPEGKWHTIAAFLIERFPGISSDTWLARMNSGSVIGADGIPVSVRRPYQPQLRVYYYREIRAEPQIPFEETILFQDDYLVVADKPHFLPVIPSGRYLQETLLVRLKRKLGIETLAPIHRIDRETAGLVVFTIQPATRRQYQDLFLEKSVQKTYEAVAPWRADLKFPLIYRSRLEDHGDHFMQVREITGEPNSETHIDVLGVKDGIARYRLTPITGKKHQLRVHCTALGLPILNDRIYPELLPENTDDYAKPLQLLAKSIEFQDPVTGEQRSFQSERKLISLQR